MIIPYRVPAVCLSLALAVACGPSRTVDWDIEVGLDNTIYPSLVVSTSSMQPDEETPEDETSLGDPWGLIGVTIASPKDNCTITVEVSSGKLIRPSTFTAVLKKKGETYSISPVLKFDYDALLSVRQPFPEIVTAKVTLNGRSLPEKNVRALVRSINDCVGGYQDGEEWIDTSWLFAAYVNENHPFIDVLLKEALASGDVTAFAGYQNGPEDARHEMEAVWNVIQKRGFRYSNITRSSAESTTVLSQHVRLIGDQIRNTQANCVEGSVLFASIFRKLEMDPFLVLIPEHCFLGVYFEEEHNDYICIETTMVGESSFDDAVEEGNREFAEYEDQLTGGGEEPPSEDGKALSSKDGDSPAETEGNECSIVDIADERQAGVLSIKEIGADAIASSPAPEASAPSLPSQ